MHKEKLVKWKTTGSSYVVNDRWMKLRADTCITPSGHELSPFYVIEYGDWVSCLVLSNNGEATLLRHYRHGIDDYVLEVVAGGIDKGEAPDAAISRELEEEVGLQGAAIHQTGICYANPSNQTNKIYNFVAMGGTFDGTRKDELGADFQIVKMPFSELKELIEDQAEVMQGLHLASIFLALNFLKKHPKKYS